MKEKPYFEIELVPSEETLRRWIAERQAERSPIRFLIDKYTKMLNYCGYYYYKAGFITTYPLGIFHVRYDSFDHEQMFGTIAAAKRSAKNKLKELGYGN